jgi:hypothetical protein
VPETDRLAIAVCREAGKQASLPLMLRVRAKTLTSGLAEPK